MSRAHPTCARIAPLVMAALAACAPQPRSASYFAGHLAEAKRVLAACREGRVRGAECQNAEAGPLAAADAARLKMYRQGFAP